MSQDQFQRQIQRLQENAQELDRLIDSSNIPDEHIDIPSLKAISLAFGTDQIDLWQNDRLEQILLVRDGVYEVRDKLKSLDEGSEFGVERFLIALDRIHADLSSVTRALPKEQLSGAQNAISVLKESQFASSTEFAEHAPDINDQANQIMTTAHHNVRNITINIFSNISLSADVDLFRSAKLSIRRLSASAFAIKCSLKNSIVFEGIFKFLTDGADKVIADLREFAQKIKKNYASAVDMLRDFEAIAETGSRFVRTVRKALDAVFGDDDSDAAVSFRIENAKQSHSLSGACVNSHGLAVVVGRLGYLRSVDLSSGEVVSEDQILGHPQINCVERFRDGRLALGTDEGLALVREIGTLDPLVAPFREKVVTVARLPRGLVTGSADGHVRWWTISEGRVFKQETMGKFGKSIQAIERGSSSVFVACAEKIVELGEDLTDRKEFQIHFRARYLRLSKDKNSLFAVGDGAVSSINLTSGIYIRNITANQGESYTSVVQISDEIIVVGSEAGNLVAFNIASGVEVGHKNIDMAIKALAISGQKILAVGGGRNRGRSAVMVSWKREQLNLEPLAASE